MALRRGFQTLIGLSKLAVLLMRMNPDLGMGLDDRHQLQR